MDFLLFMFIYVSIYLIIYVFLLFMFIYIYIYYLLIKMLFGFVICGLLFLVQSKHNIKNCKKEYKAEEEEKRVS